jgi:hypothetical protein
MNAKQIKALSKEWIINLCCDADLQDNEIRKNSTLDDMIKLHAQLSAQA